MAARRSKRRPASAATAAEGGMSIEFLLVVFPDDQPQRAVLADGDKVGFTNHILLLPANEYEIRLDGAACVPPSQTVVLSGTSAVKPKVIAFAAA